MPYSGSYDTKLVILSVIIAIVSSFATFKIIYKITVLKKTSWKFLVVGASIMSLGIWVMHFIGLLSYHTRMVVTYNLGGIFLSFLVAFVASFILLFLILKSIKRYLYLLLGTLLMAIGIIGMHQIGMKSVDMEVSDHYNWTLFTLSFILSLFVSAGYFVLSSFIQNSKSDHVRKKILGSIIIGLGLSGIHYSAMAAVTLTVANQSHYRSNVTHIGLPSISISTNLLAYLLGLATIIILLTIITLTYSDKNRAEHLQLIWSTRYQSLFKHNPNLVFCVDNFGTITSVNPKVIEILKYKYEQIISSSLFSLFNEEDQEKIKERLFHFLDDYLEMESDIVNQEGKVISMLITFVPMIIGEKVIGFFVVAKDNTELLVYKKRMQLAEQDLINILKRQQGMTLKYAKVGTDFIHTFAEGELLFKLGLSPNMIVGKSLYDLLPREEAERKFKAYSRAWNGNVTYYEANLNGTDYYVCISPVYQNGKVIEVIGSGVDVTERKKAERILEDSEKRYKNILSVMSEGIFIYNAHDQKIPLNKNAYQMFGWDLETFEKISILNNDISFVDENGMSLKLEDNPIFKTLKTGKSLIGKVIGIRGEDRINWLSVNTKLLEPTDYLDVPQVLVTMTDITKQKVMEIKLRESNALKRTILDNLPIGIIVINTKREIMVLNYSCYHLFNISIPIKNVIGQRAQDFYQNFYKNIEVEKKQVNDILLENNPRVDEFETANGKFIKRTYFPFYMDQELKGYLWTFEDITSRRKMEKRINQTKEEAIKANLAKSKFLSNMSHELRTPLNGILGFSQLLELDEALGDQQKMFVQEILKGGRHLLNLINEILDLSRIESGKLKINNDSLRVGEIISECINLIGPSAKNKGIDITLDLNHCTDKYVYADQVRLRQIILNLLDNAIKYNLENGKIIITCECNSELLYLHIKDTGLGISEEEQRSIFNPFYRIANAQIDGAGIGLSLVKQLIHLMGGNVGVKSSLGEGSDFWISIPLANFSVVNHKTTLEKISFGLPENIEYKVLYIEDNQLNLDLVKEVLGRVKGIKLISAMSGHEGLRLILEQDFDLLLLDLNLPDIHGFEVLDRIRSNPSIKHLPVIALSANAMPSDIELAMNKGFLHYFTKPIHVSAFLNVVTEQLLQLENNFSNEPSP